MALFDSIEKLGRVIFESPFATSVDIPELAEIRLAVVDAVKSRSHRIGSVRIFSDNLVRVHLRGVPEAQAKVFEGETLAELILKGLRSSLDRSSIRYPGNLRAEVQTTAQLPTPGEGWVSVDVERDIEQPASLPAQPESRSARPARLLVLQGTANKPELELNKARTNIGRTIDVFHSKGPSRRNDLAFIEENEINRTVSREHAHISFQEKSGEYRLFNDRLYKGEACGLWIMRGGLGQPVHCGQRGTVLQSDDEIHLGRAVIQFVPG
jgi:hypothetical protein